MVLAPQVHSVTCCQLQQIKKLEPVYASPRVVPLIDVMSEVKVICPSKS